MGSNHVANNIIWPVCTTTKNNSVKDDMRRFFGVKVTICRLPLIN